MMCQEFSTCFQCPIVVISLVVMCAACWANQVVNICVGSFLQAVCLFFAVFLTFALTPKISQRQGREPYQQMILIWIRFKHCFSPYIVEVPRWDMENGGMLPPTGHNGCRWFARLANPEDWWKEGWWWCSTGSLGCIEVTWICNFLESGEPLGRHCFLEVFWLCGCKEMIREYPGMCFFFLGGVHLFYWEVYLHLSTFW